MALTTEREEELVRLLGAVAQCPSDPAAHLNLGRELICAGEHTSAIQSLAAAIGLQPDLFEAYHQLGALQQTLGDLEAAKSWFLLAASCSGATPDILVDLGTVCQHLGQEEEASAFLLRVLRAESLDAATYFALGAALAKIGLTEPAMDALSRSIRLQPQAATWTELGACQYRSGDPIAAESSYREALRCDSGYPAAHANLGMALLLQGDYTRGFAEFEWRLELRDFYRIQGFDAPQWRGEPLAGKTILLHAEQGYGDTLQFLRYVPLVAARGGQVLLIVQSALQRFAARYPGVAECLPIGAALPHLHFHCSLMSLPFLFGTTLATIPVTHLQALKQDQGSVRQPALPLRIGLAWAGNPRHLPDKQRSLHLSNFGPLARFAPAATFLSLQHGPAANQLREGHLAFRIEDACAGVTDFADTAGIVSSLDLVITVDTAVAHLAGSMGKPVWLLLGTVPEWRWGLVGTSSPWYPTARLFRATREGGWTELMKEVAAELETFDVPHLVPPPAVVPVDDKV